jgi:phage tail-like protein
MPPAEARNFRYLNRAGTWPDFTLDGLVLQDDGSLQLSRRAVLIDELPATLFGLAAAPTPGGVAVDELGNLYWSDPDCNRVLCESACDGSIAPLPCVGEGGIAPSQLRAPRGLLLPANRQTLFVVDSGNNRIQAFDLATFQLVEILPASAAGNVAPGAAPGKFSDPWSCAADSEGNFYVLDYGNHCVQKFLATGDADATFYANLSAANLLVTPVEVAVTTNGSSVRVCVADVGASAVFFFDGQGNPEKDAAGTTLKIPVDPTAQPMGMAATPDTLFLGDNNRRRILQFQLSAGKGFGSSVEVCGYQGPVSALTFVSPESLYAYPGGGLTPLKIKVGGGFVPLGAAWSKRIDLGYPVKWHELIAEFEPLVTGAHLDVFAYASSVANDVPVVSEDPVLRTFFGDPRWQRQGRGSASDVTGMYIGISNATMPKQRYLWVGAELRSLGAASATLKNLRLEFNQEGYLPLLPAIYATEPTCGDFLPRLLALFQGFFEGVELEITNLPELFDPALTPKAFIDWLAGWMGVEIDESWPEAKQRQAISEAFLWFGRRGTRKGFEHTILFVTGIPVVVEEPIQQMEWWCLAGSEEACCADCATEAASIAQDPLSEDSVLGWSTMLAPSDPNGAVLGATAVLDQSKLITDEEFGSPLFSDVAYQFSVLVPRSALACPEAMAKLRAVIEAEMPAHTTYRICIVDPLMRVGYQSRVGIDSIVGGPPPSMRLGEGSALGTASVLGGSPPALLGQQTRIGITARIA